MKRLTIILILGIVFSSCKKEEEEIKPKKVCMMCKDKTYLRTDKQPKEIVISNEPIEICSEEFFNKKTTTSVLFDFADILHPVYRYETDCIDSTNIVVDTTNNNIGG